MKKGFHTYELFSVIIALKDFRALIAVRVVVIRSRPSDGWNHSVELVVYALCAGLVPHGSDKCLSLKNKMFSGAGKLKTLNCKYCYFYRDW